MPRTDGTGPRLVQPYPDENAQVAGSRKVFVGGLPASVTDVLLRQHFEQVCVQAYLLSE